jgi:hypothetical protein
MLAQVFRDERDRVPAIMIGFPGDCDLVADAARAAVF